MASERRMTVDEYERIAPYLDGPSELVDGKLRLMPSTGFLHGVLANRIGSALGRYVEEHPDAGEATGAETGFRIDNPQHPVQAPDTAFVAATRVPISTGTGRDDPAMRFMRGAPDLAVEVRSPDDTIEEMQAKARRWLAAGSQEVWLVDGLRLTVEVWRPDAPPPCCVPAIPYRRPRCCPDSPWIFLGCSAAVDRRPRTEPEKAR